MPAIFSILVFIFFSVNSFAAELAGRVVDVRGFVQAQSLDELLRDLTVGDKIYSEDTLITNKRASLKVRFSDGSKFDLGPDTIMEIEQYYYNKQDEEDSFSTRIFKGTFRFVTGLIASGNPQAMDVNLPVATIGIRGTHVVAEVTPTSAKIVLLKPEKPKPTAILVSNDFGSVMIDKLGYGTEIPDEFSPPSPMRRMQLRTVDNLMRSIQGVQRIRVPSRPRM